MDNYRVVYIIKYFCAFCIGLFLFITEDKADFAVSFQVRDVIAVILSGFKFQSEAKAEYFQKEMFGSGLLLSSEWRLMGMMISKIFIFKAFFLSAATIFPGYNYRVGEHLKDCYFFYSNINSYFRNELEIFSV